MTNFLDGNHQCSCLHHLQYNCYHSVTIEAGMCLTAYYLSLLRVHQMHAKQDALNEGHHQWHQCHGCHLAMQIFCSCHCLQYNCYQGVTLEAGTTYCLSLLQVHLVHAEQDTLNKGHHQWLLL